MPAPPPSATSGSIGRCGSNTSIFLGNVLRGDFGRSFVFNMPVFDLIMSRLPATLELTVAAVLGATLIGVPLGIYAGYRHDSPAAKAIMGVSILGFSVPTFWVGLILILTFAVWLGWLPAGNRGETVRVLGVEWSFLTANGLRHLLLPALNLSLFKLAMMIRLARAGTREVMLTDTVKFARAAGAPGSDDPAPSRPETDLDPDRHGVRTGIRLDPRLRSRDRDHLLVAGHRQADHRFDQHLGPARNGRRT